MFDKLTHYSFNAISFSCCGCIYSGVGLDEFRGWRVVKQSQDDGDVRTRVCRGAGEVFE